MDLKLPIELTERNGFGIRANLDGIAVNLDLRNSAEVIDCLRVVLAQLVIMRDGAPEPDPDTTSEDTP